MKVSDYVKNSAFNLLDYKSKKWSQIKSKETAIDILFDIEKNEDLKNNAISITLFFKSAEYFYLFIEKIEIHNKNKEILSVAFKDINVYQLLDTLSHHEFKNFFNLEKYRKIINS